MARLKKGVAYRRLDRPYTRKSKYREKNFVRATPTSKVVKYDMGNTQKEFPIHLDCISLESFQFRHNAIEAARLTCNRALERDLGKSGYHLKIRVYPHQILRENPLATGAGADRMSTGMKKAFGKPIGLAARIKEGQVLFSVSVEKQNKTAAKSALQRMARM